MKFKKYHIQFVVANYTPVQRNRDGFLQRNSQVVTAVANPINVNANLCKHSTLKMWIS